MNYKALIFDLFGVLVEFGPQDTIITIPQGIIFFNQCKSLIEKKSPATQLYVLSNARKATINFLQQNYPEIFNHFVGITTSEHAGAKKPALKIFRHFLQSHNLSAQECIFIDDTYENIKAAQVLGFSVINYNNANQALKDLQILL